MQKSDVFLAVRTLLQRKKRRKASERCQKRVRKGSEKTHKSVEKASETCRKSVEKVSEKREKSVEKVWSFPNTFSMAAKPKKIHDFEGGGVMPKTFNFERKKGLFSPKQGWAQIPWYVDSTEATFFGSGRAVWLTTWNFEKKIEPTISFEIAKIR